MKKILFDLTKTQPVNGSKYHGGGKYGLEVFYKLAETAPQSIVGFYNDDLFIEENVLKICQKNNIPLIKASEKSIMDAAKEWGKVIYSPLFDPIYNTDPEVEVILTIHDMRPLEMVGDTFEKFYKHKRKLVGTILLKLGLSNLRQWLIQKKKFADTLRSQRDIFTHKNFHIVTVSEHSKSAMQAFVPTLNDKDVQVYYAPSTTKSDFESKNCSNEYGKYYLIVSGNRWLKNGARAMLALDQLFSERPDFTGKVVITGLSNLSDITIKFNNPERFICRGYVDEDELASLYQNAYTLVYPSLNEGFGYPPMEAMHKGCPVLASATASITEICGDSVIYFNPYLINEIKMRILALENQDLRNTIIAKGFAREKEIRQKQNSDLEKLCSYILSFGEEQ
ncbi:glycosyltransferase family 1 protein [Fibrobacter sp. UWEL]|uniref:glycosyltransferase family 4 protein n=1 Tax=Fibrobacter sp. UWEL TaxID=1896209 RepID=UPI000916579F|nr:glycosyltransferase family 1 protein [Fibrobacter sp. UWEL]SHK91982.1 Glycosyltransferase involved in cell wall bisynthesis [Fibrobacter sp. UWEL]